MSGSDDLSARASAVFLTIGLIAGLVLGGLALWGVFHVMTT